MGMGLSKKHPLNSLVDVVLDRVAKSTNRVHPGRVTYIIGNNGTGKSRVLGELAQRLRPRQRARRTVACIANSLHDRFTFGDHDRVIYLGARNAGNAIFQAASDRQLARLILQAMQYDRKRFSDLCGATNIDFSFVVDQRSIMELRSPKRDTRDSSRLLKRATTRDLLASKTLDMLDRIAAGTGRFESLTRAQIPVLLKYLDLSVGFDVRVTLRDGKIMSFSDLSTGEQNRVLVFAKVLSVMDDRAVFLIDEPEVSLHLHWQMKFHESLMKLLERQERFHAVIATHAPIIISEAAKCDRQKDHNMVAVLRHKVPSGQKEGELGPGIGEMTVDMHTFNEVQSHDQLVLRYFHTSPYEAREMSVEIADTVLSVAEKLETPGDAVASLEKLLDVVGIEEDAKKQIRVAIKLINKGIPELVGEVAQQ